MTASLYTDAHGELQQKKKKKKKKKDMVAAVVVETVWEFLWAASSPTRWTSCTIVIPPQPAAERTTIISELRGTMDVDVFQALPVPGRGAWCVPRQSTKHHAMGTRPADKPPRVQPWGGPDDCLNSTHKQTGVRKTDWRDFLRVFFTGVRNRCEYFTMIENNVVLST